MHELTTIVQHRHTIKKRESNRDTEIRYFLLWHTLDLWSRDKTPDLLTGT